MFARRALTTVARNFTSSKSIAKPLSLRPSSFTPITSSVFSHSFASLADDGPNAHRYIDRDSVVNGRQYEVALLGNFPDAPTLSPFGTLERPALIFSNHHSRIVGCVGGENLKHGLLWFNLKQGKKHVCSECGQVFKLVNDETYDEVKQYVDQRTRLHYENYGTLMASTAKIEKQMNERLQEQMAEKEGTAKH